MLFGVIYNNEEFLESIDIANATVKKHNTVECMSERAWIYNHYHPPNLYVSLKLAYSPGP